MKKLTARTRQSLLIAPAIGLGLVMLLLLGVMALVPDRADAADPVKTGYVVVRSGQYDSMVRVFTFTQAISSYRALELTGLNPLAANSSWGMMLCGIDGVGKANSTGDACDNGTYYWATSYWSGGKWESYLVGVGDAVITQSGHIDGYSWVDWTVWPSPEPPHGPGAVAAYNGLEYLRPLQDPDDGGYGTDNDAVEMVYATTANRYETREWRRSEDAPSLFAALLAAGQLANQHVGGAGKLATALAAADGCVPQTVSSIASYYDSSTGLYNENAGWQAWAIIGLRALSQTIPAKAVEALEELQNADGGWPFGAWSTTSDTNGTAVAVQALIAAGEDSASTTVVEALDYLEDAQNTDGGFPYEAGDASDTDSTAYVTQAIQAAGGNPTADPWETDERNTPVSYMIGLQLASGAFEWQTGSGVNQLATMQAVPALLNRPVPWAAAALPPCAELFMPVTVK
jgi:hypothetical protein